jgi:hypothetical protein
MPAQVNITGMVASTVLEHERVVQRLRSPDQVEVEVDVGVGVGLVCVLNRGVFSECMSHQI